MTLTRRGLLAGSLAATLGRAPTAGAAAEPELVVDVNEGVLALKPKGPPTRFLRYGTADGPLVLHARQGQATAIRIRNRLKQPTSFRLSGLRGVGRLDDPETAPLARIAPGSEVTARFTPADGGTAWFHAQIDAENQTAQGLAGVLIVDPAGVGPVVDSDLVVVLRDWALDGENQLAPSAAVAPVVTLNNKPVPAEETARPGARLRLRLVNGSTSRVMLVACEGAKPMIVAIDGQPSELFEPVRDIVPIGPGARYDLILDLPRSAEQSVRFVLRGTEAVGGAREPDRPLLTITTRGEAIDPKPPITALPPNPALPPMIPLESSRRAELTIDQTGAGWTINGVSGQTLPDKPVLRVRKGGAVTFGFTNASNSLVPLRLDGQAVRLLHRNDDGWEPYWRDTVLLPPGSRTHVAFVAGVAGRWPIKSGFFNQTLGGLRCWYEVTA